MRLAATVVGPMVGPCQHAVEQAASFDQKRAIAALLFFFTDEF